MASNSVNIVMLPFRKGVRSKEFASRPVSKNLLPDLFFNYGFCLQQSKQEVTKDVSLIKEMADNLPRPTSFRAIAQAIAAIAPTEHESRDL